MPLITYTTVCTSKTLLARGVYEFTFSKPAGFTFKPGQFILFNVPLIGNPGDVQTRAFSIASTPEEPDFLFIVKIIPGGRASRWFEEAVDTGTTVTFTGPFGNFTLAPEQEKNLLFLATGTGMAPFRPMIMQALKRTDDVNGASAPAGEPPPAAAAAPSPTPRSMLLGEGEGRKSVRGGQRKIDLIFCVKTEADLFWKDELEVMAKHHPGVHLHLTLSAPSPSWTGHRGRVQVVTPLIMMNNFSDVTLYACGNPEMTKEVKKLAVEDWGMEKKDVHVEGYI